MKKDTIMQPHLFLSQHPTKPCRHTIRHFIEAMRRHDPELVEHGKRTAIYTLAIGQRMGLAENTLSELCQAALLHDLGKLTLPNRIIRHNGLSLIGDYLMTECTPQATADILRSWPTLQGIAKIIALHHERWDGNGLPFGMRGTFIPLGARILALTDTIDQLVSQHSLLLRDEHHSLIRILRNLSGSRFDPQIVEVFIETFQSWHDYADPKPPFNPFSLLEDMQDDSRSLSLNVRFVWEERTHTYIPVATGLNPHLKAIFEITNSVFCDFTGIPSTL